MYLFSSQRQNVGRSQHDVGGASEEFVRRVNAMPGLYGYVAYIYIGVRRAFNKLYLTRNVPNLVTVCGYIVIIIYSWCH